MNDMANNGRSHKRTFTSHDDDNFSAHQNNLYSCDLSLMCPTLKKNRFNKTRFKDELLSKMPNIKKTTTKHRKVLLSLEENIGQYLHTISKSEQLNKEDETLLMKAAYVLRKEAFDHHSEFTGTFQHDCKSHMFQKKIYKGNPVITCMHLIKVQP